MYYLNPRLAADIFDNEYVIANLDTGLYYNVQGSAVSLLQALPFDAPVDYITQVMQANPANAAGIETELGNIWQQLLAEEIVKQSDAPVTPANRELPVAGVYVPSRFNRYADMQDLLMLDPIHDVDEEGWAVKQTP